MHPRCVDLTDEAARDATLVGGKAAALAAASAAGLPVLPGVVVPVAESQDVVRRASAVPQGGRGARPRLAAMTVEPDEQLLAEVRERVVGYGTPLIVRSSSPLESDGTWSGAFSTFHGVGNEDLGTAIRGCWGSAFSPAVLVRARESGTEPHRLGLAVLVQPELRPDVGGTARLHADGRVRIVSTRGPLRPLMQGDVEGETATVGADDTLVAPPGADRALMFEVAALCRQVHAVLDHRLIEWAATAERVHLLQSIRSGVDVAPQAHRIDPALGSDVAIRVAALAQRFPGRLGHQLVLPWALAANSVTLPTAVTSDVDPLDALAAARAEADLLTAAVWGGSPQQATAEAHETLRRLRGDMPAMAVQALSRLPSPPSYAATQLLELLAIVRGAMRTAGLVGSDEAFWRLGADEAERALRNGVVAIDTRFGVGVWEPFVHGVVTASGERFEGAAAAPGAGAARAHVVGDSASDASPTGRYVMVAGQPLPALAPLLWNAAGLVTRAGSTSAHLIEFARSIGVPTVVGCALPRLDPTGDLPLIAVDGDRGSVSLAWIADR